MTTKEECAPWPTGAAYEQAAGQAGYATRSRAYKAFWKAMDHREAEAVEHHRALAFARLDALHVPLWEKAMNGDVKAAGMVLKIMETRSRLLGLDKQSFGQGAQTVVMSPAELAAWKKHKSGTRSSTDPTLPSGKRDRLSMDVRTTSWPNGQRGKHESGNGEWPIPT